MPRARKAGMRWCLIDGWSRRVQTRGNVRFIRGRWMGEIMKGVRMNIRAKSVCLVSLAVVILSMSMFLSAGTLDSRRDRWKTRPSLP